MRLRDWLRRRPAKVSRARGGLCVDLPFWDTRSVLQFDVSLPKKARAPLWGDHEERRYSGCGRAASPQGLRGSEVRALDDRSRGRVAEPSHAPKGGRAPRCFTQRKPKEVDHG
jgi:hypothetical protein